MPRDQINELAAFLLVARHRSFTKAAAELGVTASALSHTIKRLEERLGVRLLARTTRNVAPTELGEAFQRRIGPLFEQVDAEIEALSAARDKPSGTLRITCDDAAIEMILRPQLGGFLLRYPDIHVEISMDYALVDIVGEQFDAGVRIGESIDRDMVATRIGPDWRFCVIGSPAYFERRSAPATPQELTNHNCINMKMSTAGGNLRWEFCSLEGRDVAVRVNGQATFSNTISVLNGALDGLGLGFVPEPLAAPYLAAGQLHEVLADWCPMLEGYHLYYPTRKQHSPAFAAFVEAMRYRRLQPSP